MVGLLPSMCLTESPLLYLVQLLVLAGVGQVNVHYTNSSHSDEISHKGRRVGALDTHCDL